MDATVNAAVSDELSKKLKTYRISNAEYALACQYLGREPKGVEWALFSALWSEHCSYKSSKFHLKGLYNKSKRVVQGFGENAGVIDLGLNERVAFKIESHNHPSFIEPYQGAATGVGGILRDIFTMGARPVALANYLCFGESWAPRMTGLVDGVVRGIGGYGNCVGVPTITGQTEFHESYNNNILVNAMAVGLFRPGDKIFLSKAKGPGNWVIYVGAKTGRDGVHGASMASESFGSDSAAKRPTVQIGDPFFEKLLIESCLEVMKKELVVAIQDMGAAGLTSSSFEMAAKGGVGLVLDLDAVPLRDASMTPEDILLSESQERMLLICEPKNFKALEAVFHRWGLDAVKIGEVTEKKTVQLKWHAELLTEIDPDILVEKVPQHQRPFKPWIMTTKTQNKADLAIGIENSRGALQGILRDVRGTSREWIYRQYDQRVGGATARDCRDSVGIVYLPSSHRGLGIVLGCRPHIMRHDALIGGADAVAYPALELAAKGFEPLAVTDCLNFGNPERENIMGEFVAALKGMNAMCEGLQTPIISGNVSFYNETNGKNITSTPATGLVGLRPSLEGIPLSHFGAEKELIYVLRVPGPRLGGYLQEQRKKTIKAMGDFNVARVAKFVQSIERICSLEGVKSSRVVGKYGLAYAFARMCIGAGVGAEITEAGVRALRQNPGVDDLFHEHLYEVIVTVSSDRELALLEAFNAELSDLKNLEMQRVGLTGGPELVIGPWLKYSVTELKQDYSGGWGKTFEILA